MQRNIPKDLESLPALYYSKGVVSKQAKTMKAKILEVVAVNTNENPGDGDSSYTYKVYEFSNGLIQVPCDTTHDYFFDSKESIQCSGTDVVKEILWTGEFIDISVEILKESIKGSEEGFGVESVPQNAYELIHNAN